MTKSKKIVLPFCIAIIESNDLFNPDQLAYSRSHASAEDFKATLEAAGNKVLDCFEQVKGWDDIRPQIKKLIKQGHSRDEADLLLSDRDQERLDIIIGLKYHLVSHDMLFENLKEKII